MTKRLTNAEVIKLLDHPDGQLAKIAQMLFLESYDAAQKAARLEKEIEPLRRFYQHCLNLSVRPMVEVS